MSAAPVSAAAVPFSFIPVLPRAAGLGPQIRTPPTLIRERQDVRQPAGQPCKPLAAEVKGRRKEQSHTVARGTWLRGPGGERCGFGRKEPGLGFGGNIIIRELTLSSLQRLAPCLKIPGAQKELPG